MPFSSPTTTRAVKEKRRPPLTTLATRLISTTRSWRSRPAGETDLSGAAIEKEVPYEEKRWRLEGQSTLARALGEGLHATVVLVAAAVEHSRLDAGGLRALGEQLAGTAGLVHARQGLELGLRPRDGREGAAGRVVDELRHDAPVGAEHGDARALRRARDLGTDAAAALEALGGLGNDRHARLPTFRATYSPS